MSDGRWLAIAPNLEEAALPNGSVWWCVSPNASIGDRILLYRPRSVDKRRHGIYGEAVVVSTPTETNANNFLCSCYRGMDGKQLSFVLVQVERKFSRQLTAATMKSMPVVGKGQAVRKNFQGTTFQLTPKEYDTLIRGIELLESKSNQEAVIAPAKTAHQ